MAEVRVAIRVRPGAARTSVGGSYPGPRGSALLVAVRARAVEGRATEAALGAVAAALGLRRAAVRLVTGAGSRDKLVAIDPAPDDVEDRLTALRDGQRGFRDKE
jgi:uncharacterized protein YggU (UPF0235/DUF167 family)